YFPGVPLVIDAGIGAPSHAAAAMELGYDAVLLNTAVATAADPVRMARAFAAGIEAGRTGYEAGLMPVRDMAVPSTPVAGTPCFAREPRGGGGAAITATATRACSDAAPPRPPAGPRCLPPHRAGFPVGGPARAAGRQDDPAAGEGGAA